MSPLRNFHTGLVTLVPRAATEKVHLALGLTEKLKRSPAEVGHIQAGFMWLQHSASGRLWPPGPREGADGPAELVPRRCELQQLGLRGPEQSPYGGPSGIKHLQPTAESQVLGILKGVRKQLRPHTLPFTHFAIPSSQVLNLWHPLSPAPSASLHKPQPHLPLSL